jgi:argininosuccinate synthase
MINESQQTVTGTVKLKLYKGSTIVTGRKANNSLYNKHMTSFDDMTAFNTSDSTGFINISALRLKAWSHAQAKLTSAIPATKL